MSVLDQWQRLAPLALLFMLVSAIQKFIRENLFLFAGAGFGAAVFDWMGVRELILLGLAFLLSTLVGTIVYHRRFRFRIEDDAVRVRRGLIEKKETKVRFARVQSVQINQPFYFRPFGLVRFALETPGAQQAEVELPGIQRALAEAMRDRIVGLQRSGSAIEAMSADGHETQAREMVDQVEQGLLFRASTGRLFLHGLSSNQVWLLAGAAAYVFGNFFERLADRLDETAWLAPIFEQLGSLWLIAAAIIFIVLVVLFPLSGLLAIVRFHGFRLADRGDRLVGIGGLLDQREQTVKREKVTGLTVRQSAIGRLLGCWQLVIRQTTNQEQEAPWQKKAFLVPGLRARDLVLIDAVVAGWDYPPSFELVSGRFRRHYSLHLAGWITLAAGLLSWLTGRPDVAITLLLPVLVALLAVVHLRYRHWGWAMRGGEIWVRQGFIGQRADGFDLERAQQIQVTQSPYQRRNGLANLNIMLPQGSVTVPYLPLDQAAELANQALLAAETSMMHRV